MSRDFLTRGGRHLHAVGTIFRYRMAKVGEIEIFYRKAGPQDAPAFLLLHGFPTASHIFRDLISQPADHMEAVARVALFRGERPFAQTTVCSSINSHVVTAFKQRIDIAGQNGPLCRLTVQQFSKTHSLALNASLRRSAAPWSRDRDRSGKNEFCITLMGGLWCIGRAPIVTSTRRSRLARTRRSPSCVKSSQKKQPAQDPFL